MTFRLSKHDQIRLANEHRFRIKTGMFLSKAACSCGWIASKRHLHVHNTLVDHDEHLKCLGVFV